jgi:hypothetical protein
VIEAKRKHVLEDMGEETFPEFYQTSKGTDVIQQIYNYMGGNELRYGILTTYDKLIITGSYVESIQISGFQKPSHFILNLHLYSKHMLF